MNRPLAAGAFTVVAFGDDCVDEASLLDAAAAGVAVLVRDGTATAVVAPSAMPMLGALTRAGLRAAALAPEGAEAMLADLLDRSIVPVIEGDAAYAIALAGTHAHANAIVYTAEPPVMSADPERVESAVPISYLNHLELLEMSGVERSPISARAAQDAHVRDVAYEIRSLASDGGTVIRREGYEDRARPIAAIAVSGAFTVLSVRPSENDEARWLDARATCLEKLAAAGISVEMLQFVPSKIRFIVTDASADAAEAVLIECGLAWRRVSRCAKICIVGAGIRTTAGVFYRALTGLAQRNIPVLLFSDSNVTISLIVPNAQAGEAEVLLHDALTVRDGESINSPITFDASRGRIRIDGRERRLGARQAELLAFMIENAGRVVESEEAARRLFGSDGKEEIAAVRVHMHNLRKKIEEDPDAPRYLVTMPGRGYLFVR